MQMWHWPNENFECYKSNESLNYSIERVMYMYADADVGVGGAARFCILRLLRRINTKRQAVAKNYSNKCFEMHSLQPQRKILYSYI